MVSCPDVVSVGFSLVCRAAHGTRGSVARWHICIHGRTTGIVPDEAHLVSIGMSDSHLDSSPLGGVEPWSMPSP